MAKEDLQETIESYLKQLASRGYSKETIDEYRYLLGIFTRYMADKRIPVFSEVTSQDILSYQDYIHHDYKPAHKEVLSLGYQRNLLKALKGFFRHLVQEEKILSDPTVKLTMPKLPRKLPREILTKREIRKLLTAPDTKTARGMRDRAVIELLYSTGVRRGELEDLALYDIDLAARQIIVREGKGKKDRILPVTKKAAEVIGRYLKDHRSKLIKPGQKDPGWLFLNDRGNHLSKHWPSWLLRKYLKQCRIKKKVTTHTFRHTMATHLLQNKASIRVIQELLGHDSLTSTQIYTKVDIGDLRRVIDKSHPREQME